ncbi:MAG: 3-methyl-2-oxobutanoate hydroxymethyltransferase [Synergistaceae bacterium]|nr:3-methyl-2-oxobutanoate hydroxymethyltransferase [Synergistaceae bacterium]
MKNRLGLSLFREMKSRKEKITMLTAYNAWQARLAEKAGAEMLLVGDSVGMVEHGFPDTLEVTLEMMIHHCAAVSRGSERAFLVGDLPFLTYEVDEREAVRNAGRLIREGKVQAVKLEGGANRFETIRAIVRAGIPVMGHVGLTPQTSTALGGYKVQGKDRESARRVFEDALSVERAGAFAVVLECVPSPLAERITEKLTIPTIGIGAGPACDGQVLVLHDVLDLYGTFRPKFVKVYAEGGRVLLEGLEKYVMEVKKGEFPDLEHGFTMDPALLEEIE